MNQNIMAKQLATASASSRLRRLNGERRRRARRAPGTVLSADEGTSLRMGAEAGAGPKQLQRQKLDQSSAACMGRRSCL